MYVIVVPLCLILLWKQTPSISVAKLTDGLYKREKANEDNSVSMMLLFFTVFMSVDWINQK